MLRTGKAAECPQLGRQNTPEAASPLAISPFLARAWRWQRLLDRGVHASVSEIAEAERISKSYVSRILRLALLAPDIVEAILAGTTVPAVGFEQLEKGVPASWEEQRTILQAAGPTQ
jgi:hypothetical protein